MIPSVYCAAGEIVTLKGYAIDIGHPISFIEFSLDKGEHWTSYKTENTNDYQRLTWDLEISFPESGRYLLYVRSVNDEGKRSPEHDSIEVFVS